LVQAPQRPYHLVEQLHRAQGDGREPEPLNVGERARILQVGTRAEAVPGAGEHDHAHGVVAPQGLQRLAKRIITSNAMAFIRSGRSRVTRATPSRGLSILTNDTVAAFSFAAKARV